MRKYFFDKPMRFYYPCETTQEVKGYGVLAKYMNKQFTRAQMDKIICELITKHPYIEGAVQLKIAVMWTDNGATGYYHIFEFDNYNCENQKRTNAIIKYEKKPQKKNSFQPNTMKVIGVLKVEETGSIPPVESKIYSIELEPGALIDVKNIGDLWYVMSCGDGYEVYDENGNTFSYQYNENEVIDFVKNYEKKQIERGAHNGSEEKA